MYQQELSQPDYGLGKKKFEIYLLGFVGCAILTLLAFGAVMSKAFSRSEIFIIIYSAACLQFLVQVFCFLRLNTQTPHGKNNVLSFIFTGVILISIMAGSLWIMWNLNYYMR